MTIEQLFGIAVGVLIISALARVVSAFAMWLLTAEDHRRTVKVSPSSLESRPAAGLHLAGHPALGAHPMTVHRGGGGE